jgi:heterotetrameric sarcosine oxidase gamma subunit
MNEAAIQPEHPSPLQQAGVAQRDVAAGQVRIREITGLKLLRLRFFPASSSADLPTGDLTNETGQCGGTDPAFLCLGPNEWLAVTGSMEPQWLSQLLRPATGANQAVAYDLTDGLVVLRLTGAAAPWLLGKLSCLDFLAGAEHEQHCARTRLGDVAVIVHYHRPPRDDWAFDLIADRSIAAYLWSLLQASAPHANELAQASGAPQ